MLTFIQFIEDLSNPTLTFTATEVDSLQKRFGEAVQQMGELQQDGSLLVEVDLLMEAARSLGIRTLAETATALEDEHMLGVLLGRVGVLKERNSGEDLFELSKSAHYTLLLDENLWGLEAGLRDEGYKVILPKQHTDDSDIKELARGWTIVTKNAKDFTDDALHFDYDVVALENFKLIDTKPDRTNKTVVKIATALRRSKLHTRKGNFLLKIRDNGNFKLTSLG